MRNFIISLFVVFGLLIIGGLAFIYSGLFDVAASDPDYPIMRWALQTTRTRSIKVHAAGIQVPPGLDDPAKLLIGTEHFAAHCVVCHGAPGVLKGDIANHLNPQPPDLAHASDHYTPSELFWILKHGIKMTGMPPWGDHSDDELWATVGFLEKLPNMTEQDYAKLVMESMAHGGHHGGDQDPTKHDDHSHH